MEPVTRPKRHCVVCEHPARAQIEGLRMAGHSFRAIERLMKEANAQPVTKYETISSHFKRCLAGMAPSVDGKTLMSGTAPGNDDFAVLVQQRAVRDLTSGVLRVSTKDGLAAQALIDRRSEKAEDRDFMLNLARVMSGAGLAPPVALLMDSNAVEGDYREVNLAPESLRDST